MHGPPVHRAGALRAAGSAPWLLTSAARAPAEGHTPGQACLPLLRRFSAAGSQQRGRAGHLRHHPPPASPHHRRRAAGVWRQRGARPQRRDARQDLARLAHKHRWVAGRGRAHRQAGTGASGTGAWSCKQAAGAATVSLALATCCMLPTIWFAACVRLPHIPTRFSNNQSTVIAASAGLVEGLDNPFKAARYHSLVIEKDSCPEELEVTAWWVLHGAASHLFREL